MADSGSGGFPRVIAKNAVIVGNGGGEIVAVVAM